MLEEGNPKVADCQSSTDFGYSDPAIKAGYFVSKLPW